MEMACGDGRFADASWLRRPYAAKFMFESGAVVQYPFRIC